MLKQQSDLKVPAICPFIQTDSWDFTVHYIRITADIKFLF